MNDDQLAQELQRRADSAASRPDWVRRDLLPAVRHEIDARPQRVVTSNWSPRLGVAAVVAALLILVIAVPRLTPQPPAASPSPTASPPPGPDTIMSSPDFAAGVASGALHDRVVLVVGKVSVPAAAPPFSFPCVPPNGVCGLGVLDGTDPPVYVDTSYEPTTDTPGSGTWAGGDGGRDYHFPSVPIEGVLALRVMTHNHAFFIGIAGQDGAAPVRSVAEAQAIDIATVSLDQIVLVDGWMGGFTATRCLAHPVPTIALLPGRECSDELISRDPHPEPGSPVIKVQPGAYANFAPNPTVGTGNEPRNGLYALAPSLEGWCDNASAPPCWLWDVVARLNGPPVEPSVTSPATIECTRGTGLPITVIDEAGVVADCRTLDNVSASDQPHVFNPDGNLSRLWVWFTAGRCIRSVDAQLSVAPSGYDLVITDGATVPGCAGPPIGLGLELNLRTDIAASTVSATLASPQSTPSPATTPEGSRQIPCDLVAPIVVDETGLVTDCNGSTTVPAEGAALTVTNATDDQTRLIVSWAEACSSKSSLTFRRSDGGYELEVSWVDRIYICDGLPVQFRVELKLSVPIAAETVTVRYQALSPEPTPTATAVAFDCPPTWQTALGNLHPTIVDTTGLVVACDKADSRMFDWSEDHPLQIGNPRGDTSQLQLEWVGDACGGAREFTLTRSGTAFALAGRSTYQGNSCDMPRVVHAIRLTLNGRIDASSVIFDWNDAPTPTPTPSEPDSRLIACGLDGSSPITFIDHSGLVASCSIESGADWTTDVTVTRTIVGAERHLIVTWPHSLCGSVHPANVDFWGPVGPSEDTAATQPHYVLQVTRLPSNFGGCSGWGELHNQGVDLLLNADVSADDVQASVSNADSVGNTRVTVSAPAASGRFVLQLVGNTDWSAGEPIHVSAHVLYLDGPEKVNVVGMGALFGLEQLDGPLEVPPPPLITVCPRPRVVTPEADQVTEFNVSHSILGSPEYEAYFNQYGYDDQFRLPAGTYRLYANLNFSVGDDCSGERVTIEASLVITVR